MGDGVDDGGGRHARLTAADRARLDAARLVVAAQNLRHAAVRDLQDAGDVARPGAAVRQLDDSLPSRVRQGAPVHVDSAQLVHAAVTYILGDLITIG